jgi:hypothetical protein
VPWLRCERLQNEQVERALEQIAFSHDGLVSTVCRNTPVPIECQ